jgi:hypothetical protein
VSPELLARLDQALAAGELEALVIAWHDVEARPKPWIYETLSAYRAVLDAADRAEDVITVEDELDVLWGWCARSRYRWPDEPCR